MEPWPIRYVQTFLALLFAITLFLSLWLVVIRHSGLEFLHWNHWSNLPEIHSSHGVGFPIKYSLLLGDSAVVCTPTTRIYTLLTPATP
jgi:hypothetical protein